MIKHTVELFCALLLFTVRSILYSGLECISWTNDHYIRMNSIPYSSDLLEYLPKMSLKGLRVVEMLGLAPGPFCGMLLAEFGATVTVVHKIEPSQFDVMSNGKRAISVNLKSTEGAGVVRRLCASADVLLDTFRPGVMERLGLGPEVLSVDNPRLVYARLTGYGQHGHYRDKAGHDINYLALSGVLSLLSRNREPPVPPVNILADFGGGGLMCALGIVVALLERTQSGRGQVVDASMVEGAAYLSSWLFRSRKLPIWGEEPGANMLDGGAPFYGTYKTRDGKFMAVGALEPKFFSQLVEGLQLTEECSQFGNHEETRKKFTEAFLSKTQLEWCNVFDKLDACVTPVLELSDVDQHKHNASRNSFTSREWGEPVPVPAPRLSRTRAASRAREPAPRHGQHTAAVLREIGYSTSDVDALTRDGHVRASHNSSL